MLENNKDAESVRIGIIKHISRDHLRSAIHLAKLAHQTEQAFISNPDNIPIYSHRAYVIGSILLCIAFIESRINELIVGLTLNINPWGRDKINENTLGAIREAGKLDGVKRLRTLEKYQIALSILGKKQFDKSTEPYQSIDLLISLRNRLLHFEPEVQWLDDEEHRFIARFKNKNVPLNPIFQLLNRSEFPDSLLGYGCAKWAIRSSIRFVSDFDSRIEVDAAYKQFDDTLP